MASLTIRKLDEAVKAYLRLRSAGNGRSVEEEVRVILGELIQGRPELPGGASLPPSTEAPGQASRSVSSYSERNVTLIIGGGIAAFKSLELIRRLKERGLTVIVVEHVMRAILAISDQVLVLHQGQVLTTGDPRTVLSDPRVIEAYLGQRYAKRQQGRTDA
jgi:hypothetical protein